jgi:hypothetical protein
MLRLVIALPKPLPAQQLLRGWRTRYRCHNQLGEKSRNVSRLLQQLLPLADLTPLNYPEKAVG